MKRNKETFLWRGLERAAFLHLLVFGALFIYSQMEPERLSPSENQDAVVTQLISQEDFLQFMRRSKVVETEVAQDQVEDSKGPVYLGERRQRVAKPTVSSRDGSVQGGPTQFLKPDPLNILKKKPTPPISSENSSKTGIVTRGSDASSAEEDQVNPKSLGYGSMDSSQVDAEFGPLTQLNTDEYRFASFFNRYRRSLYGIWQPLVWRYSTNESLISDTAYLTKLSMHYSKNGDLIKIVKETTSGKNMLDQAAIESVKRMGNVQNIPSGLYVDELTAVVPITFSFQMVRRSVDFKVGSSPSRRNIFR